MRALNARWRGLDQPTNVLSFPAAAPAGIAKARLLGDVVLAFETMAREAADEGKPLADHYRHLVAHGFLHLLGFDHDSEADAERMEAIETRILARLGVADPYRVDEAADARHDRARRRTSATADSARTQPRRGLCAACSSG